MRPSLLFLSAALLLLTVAAVVTRDRAAPGATASVSAQAGAARAQSDSVEVRLIDREGRRIGVAYVTRDSAGVQIRAGVTGLPVGLHGVHIHARGACEPPAFESAGPHYQPGNRSHGFLDPEGPHAGDLPMLEVDAGGTVAAYDFTTARVRLSRASLLDADGSSLILHADADDYLTDTGGGSGDRVACGVIGGPR